MNATDTKEPPPTTPVKGRRITHRDGRRKVLPAPRTTTKVATTGGSDDQA